MTSENLDEKDKVC